MGLPPSGRTLPCIDDWKNTADHTTPPDAARIALYYDIFSETDFIIYLIGLTIGPAFFSAAIYLSLSRIINTFGEKLAICSAKKMTYIFVACDIVSLILQAAGGGIAASADAGTQDWTGIDIMIVGLSTQVASSTAFAAVALSLMLNVWRRPGQVRVDTVAFRRSWRFLGFLFGESPSPLVVLCRNTDTLRSNCPRSHLHPHPMLLSCRRTIRWLHQRPRERSSHVLVSGRRLYDPCGACADHHVSGYGVRSRLEAWG